MAMRRPGLWRPVLSRIAALVLSTAALAGCAAAGGGTDVQFVEGERVDVPGHLLAPDGVLRNGVMPQPQQFD